MQKGRILADEFMLQRSFEKGSAGDVWRALELNVGRLVRLRFLPEKFAADAEAMELLRNRLETLKFFRHPHVVVPERLVETDGSTSFLVSRFVEGPILDEYAEQWAQAEGTFPFHLIFDVLRPVASALDEAKARNLVHRSLSPKRIVVSQAEGVQIFDFDLLGIVRERLERNDPEFFAQNLDDSRRLAPEQLLEEPVTPQADQYALGMLAAELLLNRPLIEVETADQLRTRILTPPPLILPGQPEHVTASLQRAIHRNPADRFPTCVAFLDALAGLAAVTPLSVPLPPSAFPVIAASGASTPDTPAAPVDVNEIPKHSATESVSTFQSISSAARKASAATIASKIQKERRFRQMFYAWNILVLLGCLVAAFVFRNHLGRIWKQRDERSAAVQNEAPVNEAKGGRNVKSSESKSRPVVRRSSRKKKEEDFTDTNGTSFQNVEVAEMPDEVRFVGTNGTGKRIVFVVDASAVMGSGKSSPWEYVRKELAFSFKDLNPSQRFQVIYYNESVHFLPDGQGPEPWISVSPEMLKKAHQFLGTVSTSGPGRPAKALEKALTLRPDLVFFLSDRKGAALTPSEIAVLKSAAGSIPIHAVELGSGQEPNDVSPVRSLAQSCRGEYKWINGDLHGLKY